MSVRHLSSSVSALEDMNVRVLTMDDQHTAEDLAVWHNVTVEVYRTYFEGGFRLAPSVRQGIKSWKPDVIHVSGIWMYPSYASLSYSRVNRVPVVISPRGMLDPWAVRNSAWKKKLAGYAFEHAHLSEAACLHALNQSEADSIRQFGLTNPIAIIPNAIDVPEGVNAVDDEGMRRSNERKSVLFLGRLHPKKGLLELIAGWTKAARFLNEWELVIVGWDEGGHESQIRAAIQSQKIGDSIRLQGPAFGNDKAAAFANADAFILPSFSEGLPMAVLEAWAYGLPVIMTDACNLPEGFSAGAAMRVSPESSSIAKGLKEFSEMTPEDRQAMGGRGRQLVEQRFTWKKAATDMAAVYRWVLGQGDQPPCVQLG